MKKLSAFIQQPQIVLPSYFLENYTKMGLNDRSFLVLLQLIHLKNSGNDFPAPSKIAERMSIDENICKDTLFELIQLGFVTIEIHETSEGMSNEQLVITPLYDKIAQSFSKQIQNQKREQSAEDNLYPLFEQEYGRALTPLECDLLVQWIDTDQYDPALIKTALKESVIASVFSFRYIDRILMDWAKNGIKTVEQARLYSEKFHANKKSQHSLQTETEPKHLPLYNWVKE